MDIQYLFNDLMYLFHGYKVGKCDLSDRCICQMHQTTLFNARIKLLKKWLLSTTTTPAPRGLPPLSKSVSLYNTDWMTDDSNIEDLSYEWS